jgi:hypothetical protein
MPASIFLAAYFQMSIERARILGDNFAAQNAKALSCLYQFFV